MQQKTARSHSNDKSDNKVLNYFFNIFSCFRLIFVLLRLTNLFIHSSEFFIETINIYFILDMVYQTR